MNKIIGLYITDTDEYKSFVNCINKHKGEKSKSLMRRNLAIAYDGDVITPRSNQNIDKMIKTFNRLTSKIENLSKLYQEIEELKKQRNILARLLESYIYMRVANHTKAQNVLLDILDKDFYDYIIESDLSDLPLENQMNMTVFLLNAFEEDLKNKKVISALIFYFYQNSTGEFKEILEDEFDIPESIKEVRKKYSSIRFGKNLPFVWGPRVFEQSSQKEYLNFLKQTEVFDKLNYKQSKYLLFYRGINKIPKDQKTKVINNFLSVAKSENIKKKHIFFEMMDDEKFYKFLVANTEFKSKLISNLKRTYYRKILGQEKLKELAIYNLLSLGDIDDSYFRLLLQN